MLEAILFVAGLLVGAGALWKYKLEGLQKSEALARGNFSLAADRVKAYIGATESCHSIAFGPYGTPPATLDDAFNILWGLSGLPKKGTPK